MRIKKSLFKSAVSSARKSLQRHATTWTHPDDTPQLAAHVTQPSVEAGRRIIPAKSFKEPKITGINLYQKDIALPAVDCTWSPKNKQQVVLDSTIVQIKTDIGIDGWGEHCPFGNTYLPAYARGTRLGIQEIAPALIGENPTQLLKINDTMDKALLGHPYVKTAIDVACWDILGKVAGLPLYTLFGGKFQERVRLYRTIGKCPPEKMAASVRSLQEEGFMTFQCKVGEDPELDIERVKAVASVLRKGDQMWIDANGTWSTRDALSVIKGIQHLNIRLTFEQPCKTYEDNLFVRRKCPFPMMLDENMDSIEAVMKMSRDKAADAISLKLGKVGGLTKALQIRNLCVTLGIPFGLDDIWGWDIVSSSVLHLAHSTPANVLKATFNFSDYVEGDFVDNPPRTFDGHAIAPDGPGLGVTPLEYELGAPVVVIE